VLLGYKLNNPKLEVFYRKEENFDFKKLNEVKCTTFNTFISILNFLACALEAHVRFSYFFREELDHAIKLLI